MTTPGTAGIAPVSHGFHFAFGGRPRSHHPHFGRIQSLLFRGFDFGPGFDLDFLSHGVLLLTTKGLDFLTFKIFWGKVQLLCLSKGVVKT